MLHKPANKQLTVQWIYKQGGKDKKSYPETTGWSWSAGEKNVRHVCNIMAKTGSCDGLL